MDCGERNNASRPHCSARELLVQAEQLLDTCDRDLAHVTNIKKLRRKLEAEHAFLVTFVRRSSPDAELKCSNLPQLRGVVDFLAERGADMQAETMKSVKTPALAAVRTSITVDVITDRGQEWRKFVARNPAALLREWKGRGHFKRRTLVAQAEDYLKMAKHHPVRYQTPRIYFHFVYGVEKSFADYLQSRGITVLGTRLETDDVTDTEDEDEDLISDGDDSDSDLSDGSMSSLDEISVHYDLIEHDDLTKRVNLDITAGIALISQLCHGGCYYVFQDPVLTEQAEQERLKPVLPDLEDYLSDKSLYMCETAFYEFSQIVSTIGGKNETARFHELSARIQVVDDQMSRRTEKLVCQGKVKERSRIIFGTGDSLKSTTVTANSGFVRAAHGQGLEYTVHLHEARALTELKEATATPIDSATPIDPATPINSTTTPMSSDTPIELADNHS